ncbi:MAG: glycosyl transferase group 1 [Gemmatimonadetes bacterium]|nr:glycosyl transferase group 1 [Gemmatimonadota bacterium]
MNGASVLFVDHASVMGGAQLSLLDIAEAHKQHGAIALLEDGAFATALEARGVRVIQLGGGAALRKVKKASRFPGMRPLLVTLRVARDLARVAKPFDVLYANTPKSFLVAALAGLIARKPVIWHLRDIFDDGHFSRANVRAVVTAANWLAARVIANSHASADAFVTAGGKKALVTVVHNGIDPAPYDALPADARATVRAELGIPEDVFLVGSFSRLHPWKGQSVLLDAVEQMPGAHAIVVGGALFSGEGRYEVELRTRVAGPSFGGRVSMLGPRDDIPRLLAACDVVVHTSVLAEPFGRVLVEAMLAKRAVVASRAGGVPEVVTDGATGLLVPPGDVGALRDALELLRKNPARMAQLARAGAVHARLRFSRVTMLAGVNAVLTDILSRPAELRPRTNVRSLRDTDPRGTPHVAT